MTNPPTQTVAHPSQPMADRDLDILHSAICEGLITLHEQSETYGGRARTLFYAAGASLKERGILKHLEAADSYLEQHSAGG